MLYPFFGFGHCTMHYALCMLVGPAVLEGHNITCSRAIHQSCNTYILVPNGYYHSPLWLAGANHASAGTALDAAIRLFFSSLGSTTRL